MLTYLITFVPPVAWLAVAGVWAQSAIVGRGVEGSGRWRRLFLLSAPWMILFPIGIVVSALLYPVIEPVSTAAGPWIARATPIATLIGMVAGTVMLKGQRLAALAVGALNVGVSLMCGALQIVAYSLVRGSG